MRKDNLYKLCLLPMLAVLMLLVGCKSSSKVSKGSSQAITTLSADSCLSSKLELTIPHKDDATFTIKGNMRLLHGKMVQISLLMPVIRSEVARIEVTPQYVLVVDRWNRRYFRDTAEGLQRVLPDNATYADLEKALWKASNSDEVSVSGEDLGISGLQKAKVELSEFSTSPFTLEPMEITSRYTEVTLDDLLQLMRSL